MSIATFFLLAPLTLACSRRGNASYKTVAMCHIKMTL